MRRAVALLSRDCLGSAFTIMGSTGTLPYSLKNGTCEQLAQSLITVLLDYHHNANKSNS